MPLQSENLPIQGMFERVVSSYVDSRRLSEDFKVLTTEPGFRPSEFAQELTRSFRPVTAIQSRPFYTHTDKDGYFRINPYAAPYIYTYGDRSRLAPYEQTPEITRDRNEPRVIDPDNNQESPHKGINPKVVQGQQRTFSEALKVFGEDKFIAALAATCAEKAFNRSIIYETYGAVMCQHFSELPLPYQVDRIRSVYFTKQGGELNTAQVLARNTDIKNELFPNTADLNFPDDAETFQLIAHWAEKSKTAAEHIHQRKITPSDMLWIESISRMYDMEDVTWQINNFARRRSTKRN